MCISKTCTEDFDPATLGVVIPDAEDEDKFTKACGLDYCNADIEDVLQELGKSCRRWVTAAARAGQELEELGKHCWNWVRTS